jgi:hypothetical protein
MKVQFKEIPVGHYFTMNGGWFKKIAEKRIKCLSTGKECSHTRQNAIVIHLVKFVEPLQNSELRQVFDSYEGEKYDIKCGFPYWDRTKETASIYRDADKAKESISKGVRIVYLTLDAYGEALFVIKPRKLYTLEARDR